MKTSVSLASLALLAACLSGCANGDLTPELSGAANRPQDTTNNYEITNNMNVRSLSDDFNRAMLFDNPVRLSPFPIMYTSGNPR